MRSVGLWRAIALAVLLLFAQQLMLAHALEHALELAHVQGEAVEISCHDCLAFNHLPDAPGGRSAIPPLLAGAACRVAGPASLPGCGAASLAYSIRAPPVLLKSA